MFEYLQRSRTFVVATLLAMTIGLCASPTSSNAQQDRPGRKIVGDLFKSWLESELEKSAARKNFEEEAARIRERRREEFKLPNVPIQRHDQQYHTKERVAPVIKNLRVSVETYNRNLGLLGREIQVAARRDQSLRPLLAECYKLQTTAGLIQKRCQAMNDPVVITDQYRELDSHWRDLSFQLSNVPLSRQGRDYVTQLNRGCDRMCAALDLDPQFDRNRIMRYMVRGTAFIHALLDDIEIELAGHPDCDPLLNEGRRLQQMIRHDTPIVREGNYDDVVRRFEVFVRRWRQFSSKLYQFNSPHIDRRIGRVRSVGANISTLLRIAPTFDYEYAHHVAHLMEDQFSNLFDRMTVNELISLPVDQQTVLLNAASQMRADCERLCQCVKRKDKVEVLRDHYRTVTTQWNRVQPFLVNTKSPRIAKCNRQIEGHSVAIRDLLGIRQGVSANHLLELAAELEVMSTQINNRVVRLNSQYKSREFRTRANTVAVAFHDSCKSFHTEVARTRDSNRLRRSCQQVIRNWNELNVVVSSMPKNGVPQTRFDLVNRSRQETIGIVAEVAAYLAE